MVGLLSLEELEAVRASIIRDDGQNVFSSMLEACPFCGADASHLHGDDDYAGPYVQVGPDMMFGGRLIDARVVCNSCKVSTTRSTANSVHVNATDEDVTRLTAIGLAIKDWNRRAIVLKG